MSLWHKLIQYFVLKLSTRKWLSDGDHNFEELYTTRNELWMAFCKKRYDAMLVDNENRMARFGAPPHETDIWRTHTHSDDSVVNGYFLLGIGKQAGRQLSYHLPNDMWDKCDFAETLIKSPIFDGHTSGDVIKRLQRL